MMLFAAYFGIKIAGVAKCRIFADKVLSSQKIVARVRFYGSYNGCPPKERESFFTMFRRQMILKSLCFGKIGDKMSLSFILSGVDYDVA